MLDRTAVVDQLTAWITELVPESGAAGVDEDSDLSQFGGFDSIAILQLLARAEGTYDVSLADQDDVIRDARSIGTLAGQIMRCSEVGAS